MLFWLPRRRARMENIEAEAEGLVRDLGGFAYGEVSSEVNIAVPNGGRARRFRYAAAYGLDGRRRLRIRDHQQFDGQNRISLRKSRD